MTTVFQKKAECLKRAIEQLSVEATHVREFTRARVLELAGSNVGLKTFYRIFPDKQFLLLRQAWLHRRIEEAIDMVFAQACAQRDVTIQRIADLAGCHVGCVTRQAGPQIQQRLLNLPDSQEQMVLAIQRLVAARIPLHELTWARVYAEAAERPMKANARVLQAFHDGRESLIQYHEHQKLQRVPNAIYACIQEEWINVDEPVWKLSSCGKTLRRDRLRPDIASTVWLLLREEALTTDVAAATLKNHYQMALFVATLLGETIPDIRALTLASIQQVWCRYEAAVSVRRRVRTMLVRILEKQLLQEPGEDPLRRQEYVRAIQWLRTISLRRSPSEKAFLSETEFDTILDGCIKDIFQGLTYLQHGGTAVGKECVSIHAEQAEPVLRWGIGLLVLIMAFTGLRRQSLVRLQTDDLAQIGPQAFALAWRHGKIGKESLAVIPALVAEHLQHYIHMTASVRARLGTQQIFLVRNSMGRWDQITDKRFELALETFARRHELKRSGAPLRIGSTLLRRTYVTRALYELPSLAALQAQLGHTCARTTLGYAQYDRYEHPAQVDGALNGFGRKVLVRWNTPLLLDDLPDAERRALLEVETAHDQDVGLCRHTHCMKLDAERLPPCSLCEHLVSGPAYLPAWEHEKIVREQQLEQLATRPGAELLLAQMKGQYDRFLINYQFVQERSSM